MRDVEINAVNTVWALLRCRTVGVVSEMKIVVTGTSMNVLTLGLVVFKKLIVNIVRMSRKDLTV